jgi:hypothetical protein
MSSASLTRRAVLARLGLAGLALPAVLHGQPTPDVHADLQQPHMRAALEALRTAKRHLDLATPDKGGHRVKALELVNSAITETQDGIAYDATH